MIRVDQRRADNQPRLDRQGECNQEVYAVQEGEAPLDAE